MSLMGSVVTLYVLCWLLSASSSNSVNRNLMQSDPELNNTTVICPNCSIGSSNLTHSSHPLNTTSLNQQLQDADHFNKSQNQTIHVGKPSLSKNINDSPSQTHISSTPEPLIRDTSPPAKVNGPEVTSAPLSHTNKNELGKSTAEVPSHATAAQEIKPADTTETTLITTTAAIATSTSASASVTTSTATSVTSTATTTTTTTTTTAPITHPLSTAEKTSAHASTTISPAPNIVTAATISTNPKTTLSIPMEPDSTTTAATTTTTTTAASTGQHLSPGHDITRQFVDKVSLLAILLFGLLFLFVVVAVFVTQAYESYRRKDYTQVDYLINGMYTDSAV